MLMPSTAHRMLLICAAAFTGFLFRAEQLAAEAQQSAPRQNLALHAKYECVLAPNYWGWKNPKHGDHGQLTDGKIVETWQTPQGYIYSLPSSAGWSTTGAGKGPVVVFDLGETREIWSVGIHTVLSQGGPWWPDKITVLVSDDNKNFYLAGPTHTVTPDQLDPPLAPEVVQASIDRVLIEKGYKPSTHWYRSPEFKAQGRYVAMIMTLPPSTGTVIMDEVVIYGGPTEELKTRRSTQVFNEGGGGWKSYGLFQAIDQRLGRDIAALRENIAASSAPAAEKTALLQDLAALDARRQDQPAPKSQGFRAVLPVSDLHRQVFQVQAALWRAEKLPPLSAWHCHRWDPLSPIGPPGREPPQVQIVMARNEVRSDVLNISNADDQPRTVMLSGLPNKNVDVFEVPLVDTHAFEPVAAALVPLTATKGIYHIQIPAGMTRQVWFRCKSKELNSGRIQERIKLTSKDEPTWSSEVPFSIEVVDLRLPDQFSLYVGGWDYPFPGSYELTKENIKQYMATMHEYGVNVAWSDRSMPLGSYDADGNLNGPPSRALMDEWLAHWPEARVYCLFLGGSPPLYLPTDDVHYDRKLAAWAKDWADYLKSRGVPPEKLAILIQDEPIHASELELILRVGRAIKQGAPEMKIFNDLHFADPTKGPPPIEDVMRETCDIQCFEVRNLVSLPQAHASFIEKWRRPGRQWWTYSGGSAHRLTDPYVSSLLRAWFSFDKGLTGATFQHFHVGTGGFSWNEYFNAGPTMSPLYLAPDSVTTGKAMEAIREGAQDYELLMMLRQRADQSSDAAEIRRILTEGVAKVLQSHRIDQWAWNTPKDRSLADKVRIKVLRCLEGK